MSVPFAAVGLINTGVNWLPDRNQYWSDVVLQMDFEFSVHWDYSIKQHTDCLSIGLDATPSLVGNTYDALGEPLVKNAIFGQQALQGGTAQDRWLQFPASPDWDFGTGEFTIEWSCIGRGPGGTLPLENTATAICFGESVSQVWGARVEIANQTIRWNDLIGGLSVAPAGTFPLGKWNHMAITRKNNAAGAGVVRFFANGKVIRSVNYSAVQVFGNAVNKLMIGGYAQDRHWGPRGGIPANAIDEIRITKGRCRYQADYRPHGRPFPIGPGGLTP